MAAGSAKQKVLEAIEKLPADAKGQPIVVGMLTRYNRRTVTVINDSGQRWNVAPTLLSRADSSVGAQAPDSNVIRLRKK